MTDPSRKTVEELRRQTTRKLQDKGRKSVEKKLSTLKSLAVEYVNPNTIYPNAYNPNRQSERDFELLLSSMREDGFTQPILVHRKTREVIDGEHRWRASQRLGLTEIPVVFVDMTPEQMRVSTLRHNRARGSEDIELTIEMLKDLRELGALDHAIDSLGMSDKEINALISDLPAPEAQAAPEFSSAWVVDPPRTTEVRKPEEIQSSSQAIRMAEERLHQKLEYVPQDDEEKRQVILKEETTWHSIIAQISVEYRGLIESVLGDNPAHRLLQLCRFHMTAIGKPMKHDEYYE
jgi:ParB/RepB/Spo0J family partition protein